MNYNNVTFETSFGRPDQLPPVSLPEIAFCGRSNVGKSSMLNKLFNRKSIARVSSMPGKTATINFFLLEGVRFADLPGYGYAKVSKSEKARWGKLMDGYFTSGRELCLVCLLLDIRHSPSTDDRTMLNFLTEAGYPFVVILTKADKLSKKQIEERLSAFALEIPDTPLTPFSAKTGQGLSDLRGIIDQAVQSEKP